jgi:amino acid transporter
VATGERLTSETASGEGALVRAIGVRALAATTFNVMIGGGIFLLPAVVAGGLGAAAPLAYLVCAAAMGLIVLCFAEAGSRVAITGGPYAYVEVALGPYVGFLAGALLWLLMSFATAAVASGFAASVAFLVPSSGGPIPRALLLAALFAVLALVNWRGVRQAARFVEIVTVAKLLPLLVLVVAGALWLARSSSAHPVWSTDLPSAGALGGTSVALFFAFAGLESSLVPSGEVKDPARTVPRALAIAMIGVTLLYVALQLVAQGLLGAPALAAASEAPLAAAARVALGAAGGLLVAVGAVISMFGHASGMMLASPRALFAFARDGMLPRALASVHPRFQTPHVAIAVQAVVVFVLAATSGFERLARLATVSVLLLYLFCCIAAWVLRRKDVREAGTPFELPGGATIPLLACAVIAWLLSSATVAEMGIVATVLAAASVIWLLTRRAWRATPGSAT